MSDKPYRGTPSINKQAEERQHVRTCSILPGVTLRMVDMLGCTCATEEPGTTYACSLASPANRKQTGRKLLEQVVLKCHRGQALLHVHTCAGTGDIAEGDQQLLRIHSAQHRVAAWRRCLLEAPAPAGCRSSFAVLRGLIDRRQRFETLDPRTCHQAALSFLLQERAEYTRGAET